MTTQELAYEVISRLKKEYPDADCTLDYDDAWKLLVSVRLAAQCTDARVNVVVQDLYAKYPDVAALAAAKPEDIEAIVRPCGLGKSKARDISACMRILHEQYQDKVPEDFNALLKLPGVGRKSANLIMGDVFGKPAIVTDTHCIFRRTLINTIRLLPGTWQFRPHPGYLPGRMSSHLPSEFHDASPLCNGLPRSRCLSLRYGLPGSYLRSVLLPTVQG